MTGPQGANTSFFMNPQAREFGGYDPSDERLHRVANAEVSDPALVETQFFGFNVPGANIHSLNYMWLHPNVGTASGGAWAWRGDKPSQLHCEIFDMRDFMPMSLVGELDDYALPSGYRVEVVKPLEEIRVRYEAPDRDNAFDITYSAIMPPAMIASGKHFDQAMRTRGRVRLRGDEHVVDGFSVRDRSWAEARPEDPRHAPPVHWLTAVFDEDLAIHVTAIEDPRHGPLWTEVADLGAAEVDAFNRGWVWRDGELAAVTSATLSTRWDRATGYPRAHRLEVVDSRDRRYLLEGTLTATARWYGWSNVCVAVGLTRWELAGKVGWGDTQTPVWTDYARLLDH